jgi:hypothetical protein
MGAAAKVLQIVALVLLVAMFAMIALHWANVADGTQEIATPAIRITGDRHAACEACRPRQWACSWR